MPFRREWTDEELDAVIGRILRAGVVAAAVLVFAGGVAYLARYAFTVPAYHVFVPGAAGAAGIAGNISALNAVGLIQLGLLVLIATPLMRVVFSLAAFALQKDTVYVVVTALVLAVLLYSILGHGIG